MEIFQDLSLTLKEAGLALLPLSFLFLISQIFLLKLSQQKFINICAGFFLIFLGLSLFLHAIYSGFLPIAKAMGENLSSRPSLWLLIPLGFILGFAVTMAEPAIRILNYQVEKVTSGYIPQKVMLYTLSSGIGIAIALSMIRIVAGIPMAYIIIPGYLIAFLLMLFSRSSFVAIAFDSGGVATGPMTATFVTALAIGIASGIEGRNPLLDGLGLVALVALLPILSVLILGLIYGRKERKIKNQILTEKEPKDN